MMFEAAEQTADELRNGDTTNTHSVLKAIIDKVTLGATDLKIEINISKLVGLLTEREERNPWKEGAYKNTDSENPNATDQDEPWRENQNTHIIEIEHKVAKRGVEAKLILESTNAKTTNPDQTLIDIIAKAHLWLSKLTDGSTGTIHDLSKQLDHDPSEISRFLPLAFLAPDIVESIITGSQPIDLTQERLRRIPTLPIDWKDQRELLGFAS